MDERTARTLACYQLRLFIEKGKRVDQCKAEWRRRFGAEYPHTKAKDHA